MHQLQLRLQERRQEGRPGQQQVDAATAERHERRQHLCSKGEKGSRSAELMGAAAHCSKLTTQLEQR